MDLSPFPALASVTAAPAIVAVWPIQPLPDAESQTKDSEAEAGSDVQQVRAQDQYASVVYRHWYHEVVGDSLDDLDFPPAPKWSQDSLEEFVDDVLVRSKLPGAGMAKPRA